MALGDAWRLVDRGEADVAIAGGADGVAADFDAYALLGFDRLKTLSTRNDEPQRASRPFDRDRDGFAPAEGAGMMILETLEHAEARGATVLAEDNHGRPAVWRVGENAYGFSGNPGIKLGMVEDLIMEFEEVPADCVAQLERLRPLQPVLEDELVPIMTGLVQCTSLMSSPRAAGSWTHS